MKNLKLNIVGLLLISSTISFGQVTELIPIDSINDSAEFCNVIKQIEGEKDALYVFDIDNTLLVSNENLFGSDWWYAQTKENPDLKLNVSNACLFDILTPLFYAMFDTECLFTKQSMVIDSLGKGKSRTIALTSRAYTPTIAIATELELKKNEYNFLMKDSVMLSPDVIMLNRVIYTKGQNKGEILLNYVKNNSYQKIYYFDDSRYKVEDVQKSFSGGSFDIGLYYMKVAPKIEYTSKQVNYMQEKLNNLINLINLQSEYVCTCKN